MQNNESSTPKRRMKVVKDFDETDHRKLNNLLEMEPELRKLIENQKTKTVTTKIALQVLPFAIAIVVGLIFFLVSSSNGVTPP